MKNKIFIAEDDFLLARLYQRAFEAGGYDTDFARDGVEALAKLKEMTIKPNVLLVDILMPRMDGLELLKEIKKTPGIKDIPVVVFTNVTEEKEEKEAMSLGALKYLLKGEMDIKDVISEIDSLMK